MPSSYSDSLRVEKPERGSYDGTWDVPYNLLVDLFDAAIAGTSAISTTGGNTTLSANNGATDQARNMVLAVTGTLASNATLTAPTKSKVYIVYNGTSGAYTLGIKTSAGTALDLPQGYISICRIADDNTAKMISAPVSYAAGLVHTDYITGLPATSLASDSVTTDKIADDAVTSAKIADGTIVEGNLADDAVTSAKIADGTIVAGNLASDAVTTAKILDANVTADKLASDAVTTAKILDANVTEAKLSTLASLSSTQAQGVGTSLAADATASETVATGIQDAREVVATFSGGPPTTIATITIPQPSTASTWASWQIVIARLSTANTYTVEYSTDGGSTFSLLLSNGTHGTYSLAMMQFADATGYYWTIQGYQSSTTAVASVSKGGGNTLGTGDFVIRMTRVSGSGAVDATSVLGRAVRMLGTEG